MANTEGRFCRSALISAGRPPPRMDPDLRVEIIMIAFTINRLLRATATQAHSAPETSFGAAQKSGLCAIGISVSLSL